MKVKELEVTANMAWSPSTHVPIYLATGTAAQQFDASFSTNSVLDIHALNLTESGHDMPKVASIPVESRFHKLVWSPTGMDTSHSSGVIVGGADRGFITFYDAAKLIKGEEAVILHKDKHTGPVQALDFNPFQSNLLASGASESEIYIWDLNKLQTPMTPGAKSQPPDDIRWVAWNRQVQHILGTTFASRCVVWDLRKNDPIIKVSDSTSRMRCKVVAWDPDIATQLALASEDDHTPVIQIWDLRQASSPVRTLEGHQRGILSLAWCAQDPDLLLSCGKDNKILCWNPNSKPGEEFLCEVAASPQWTFDVAWCPRNPGVISGASFGGHVSIYSIMGGQQQAQPTTAIQDSFPGMTAMDPSQATPKPSVQLKNPPKWLRRPCGASFGFGGALVTFERQGSQRSSIVKVGKVVTETELVEGAVRLETSMQNNNMPEFCESKVTTVGNKNDQEMWQFIGANFDENPREKFLKLLGQDPKAVEQELLSQAGEPLDDSVEENGLVAGMGSLKTDAGGEGDFEMIAASSAKTEEDNAPFSIKTDLTDGGHLSRALLSGNIELAVRLCLKQNRMADALVLAIHGGEDLLRKTQKRYFSHCTGDEARLIRCVAQNDWVNLVSCCDVTNWKEALSAVVTYAAVDEFSNLCSVLGSRLEGQAAMICYICAGDLDRVVEIWMATRKAETGPKALQDLIEVVMTLKRAVERFGQQINLGSSGHVAAKVNEYAGLLAAQGQFKSALEAINQIGIVDEKAKDLKERLEGALRITSQPAKPQPARSARQSSDRFSAGRSSYSQPGGYQYPSHGSDQFTPYTGIHNPAVEDLNVYNPPVQHYEPSDLAHRRGSRPAIFDPNQYGGPQPSPPAASTPFNFRKPSGDNAPPQQQPPVNIFTPDYAPQPMAAPPPTAVAPLVPDQGGPGHKPPCSNGSGWNDPPSLPINSVPKAKTVPSNSGYTGNPITQPLFGSAAPAEPMPSFAPMSSGPPPMNYQQQPMPNMQPSMQHNMAMGMPMQPPMQQGMQPGPQPGMPMQPGLAANMMIPEQPAAPQAPEPPRPQPAPPVEKGPLPAEHQILKDVFDGLRNKCLSAANHPQTRRKLDDVGRKLEVLYDKIRDNALPPHTVTGLHQILQSIWAFDYAASLQMVNRLVSSGPFALLSEFLPGIKVLLQVASQLGVYIEAPKS